jgi:hypothetical protein
MRLERLADERQVLIDEMEGTLKRAERAGRDLSDHERYNYEELRERLQAADGELVELAEDVKRIECSELASRMLRGDDAGSAVAAYRTFARYARDEVIARHGDAVGATRLDAEAAADRLALVRTVEHTTSADVPGLTPAQHIAEIMDIIDASRPVVVSGRRFELNKGTVTYPIVSQRPEVAVQLSEKTEAGTAGLRVQLGSTEAETYLGAGNISWQAQNWSDPDVLELWVQTAAEAYARRTELAACAALDVGGTVSPTLGTAGTESFSAWRTAVIGAARDINTATGGRGRANTLYLSADRFFQLASLGTDQTTQMSPVGSLDAGSMAGTFFGLRVIGSYGFVSPNFAAVADSSALLVAETPGAPVQLRVVEPAIGGLEIGLIGAFATKMFDVNRLQHLS